MLTRMRQTPDSNLLREYLTCTNVYRIGFMSHRNRIKGCAHLGNHSTWLHLEDTCGSKIASRDVAIPVCIPGGAAEALMGYIEAQQNQ